MWRLSLWACPRLWWIWVCIRWALLRAPYSTTEDQNFQALRLRHRYLTLALDVWPPSHQWVYTSGCDPAARKANVKQKQTHLKHKNKILKVQAQLLKFRGGVNLRYEQDFLRHAILRKPAQINLLNHLHASNQQLWGMHSQTFIGFGLHKIVSLPQNMIIIP